MDITRYVEHLRAELVAAASSGGDAMVDAAERLSAALDAGLRMTLLEALSDAAAEITDDLDGATVEVRLKGRQPSFVVTPPPADPVAGATEPLDHPDDSSTSRITLRLPEALKVRAEEAAARSRQSMNTWLVEAIRAATRPPEERRKVGAKQLSGWAR